VKEQPMKRRLLLTASGLLPWLPMVARAHHGWSSFDQTRPLYLAGRARKVSWRNPHAEIHLEVKQPLLAVPSDLVQRKLPAQSAQVDGAALLAKAEVPRRKDAVWEIELAPLTRMEAWQVPEIKPGTELEVLGFTHEGEQGDAVLRAEYLFLGDKVYGLRSSPV